MAAAVSHIDRPLLPDTLPAFPKYLQTPITWARILPYRAFVFWLEKRGSVVIDVLHFYCDGDRTLHCISVSIQGWDLMEKGKETTVVNLDFMSLNKSHLREIKSSKNQRRKTPIKAQIGSC